MRKGTTKSKTSSGNRQQVGPFDALFYKEIENVVVSTAERKAYFKDLFHLYVSDKNTPWRAGTNRWRHLPNHERVFFFRRWFVAIADEYIKAWHKHKAIADEFEADKFSALSILVLSLPVTKRYRYEALMTFPILETKGEREEGSPFVDNDPEKLWASFRPIWQPSFKEVIQIEKKRDVLSKELKEIAYAPALPEYSALNLFYISVKYDIDEVFRILRPILEKKQDEYDSHFPQARQNYIKKDSKGRKDTYQFDEWDRYLRIYMLKGQGNSLSAIGKRFYRNNLNPEVQVSRDKSKAENLSKNAIHHDFPGKY